MIMEVVGQVLLLAKTDSDMTIDHVPILVSQMFYDIFGPQTHIGI